MFDAECSECFLSEFKAYIYIYYSICVVVVHGIHRQQTMRESKSHVFQGVVNGSRSQTLARCRRGDLAKYAKAPTDF